MEIEEHPPGQGMPARLPVALSVRTSYSHPYVWLEYGVNVEHMVRMLVKPAISM